MKALSGAIVLFVLAALFLVGINLAFSVTIPVTPKSVFGMWLLLITFFVAVLAVLRSK